MRREYEKFFCSKPFEWFEIHSNGNVYQCCPSWLREKEIGNVLEKPINEIWNSERAKKIRASILDGTFKYCIRNLCPFLQNLPVVEHRPVKVPFLDPIFNPLKLITDIKDPYLFDIIKNQRITLEETPHAINCSYDRTCNLSCPTCRGNPPVFTIKSHDIARSLRIQKEVMKIMSGVGCLYVTGSGDPFASQVFQALFRQINTEKYPNLKIFLHTNAILWTPAEWQKLTGLHSGIRAAEISIDAATKETYAINRPGGDFKKLMENLRFIKTLREKGPLQFIRISFVVQKTNFMEMHKFVALGKKFGFDEIYFSRLNNWGHFSNEEFNERAIHRPEHPMHRYFQKMLSNPVFRNTAVTFGNLADVLVPPEARVKYTINQKPVSSE